MKYKTEKEIEESSICECCGKKVKSGQSLCLKCHCEICDMPLVECVAKQQLYKRSNAWDRLVLFDDDEIKEFKSERKINGFVIL